MARKATYEEMEKRINYIDKSEIGQKNKIAKNPVTANELVGLWPLKEKAYLRQL